MAEWKRWEHVPRLGQSGYNSHPEVYEVLFVLRCFLVSQQWQRNRKGAPLAHDTLYSHLATVRGDDLLHDIEPKPGAPRFRGVQRFKNLRGLLRGDACAGITHVEGHCRALPSSPERQGPAWRHGLDRVLHQIQQRPLQGMRMEPHHAELVQGLQLERDAVCGECRGHLLRQLPHEAAQVPRGLLDRGHAHEGEIILDEIVHAGELDLDLRECVGNLSRTRG
jgi:hypothetical protein